MKVLCNTSLLLLLARIDRLVEVSLWIDERLYHRVLQAYGEALPCRLR